MTLRRADDSLATFRIVGEDEADPAAGRIAWTAPVARALLGSRPGDLRALPTGEVEVLAIDATPEAPIKGRVGLPAGNFFSAPTEFQGLAVAVQALVPARGLNLG